MKQYEFDDCYKYEFILKIKYHGSDKWNQIARSVVGFYDFENAKKAFEMYAQRGDYYDTLILINKLDLNGEFVEVVQ